MNANISQILDALRKSAAAGETPEEVAAPAINAIEALVAAQSDLSRAYYALLHIGNIIQKVSVDGKELSQDFGTNFANAIQQMIVAQLRAVISGT